MTTLSRRDALFLAAAVAAAPAARAQGGEPPLSMTWDLTDLYASDAAWEAERKALMAELPKIALYRGRLGESAATLRTALQLVSDLTRRGARLFVYASLKADEDLQVAANQERRQVAVGLFAEFGEATSWINPEVLALGAEKIRGFVAADPGLAKFRFGLEDTLRLAPHTLDAAGEALIAQATQTLSGPQQIRQQLVSSDLPWPEVELKRGKVRLDQQGYTAARSSPDRTERKLVFDRFFGALKTYESTLGASLSTQVQGDIFQAKARKYPSALAAALGGPNIPEGVYRTLVAEANRGLPILHRYFDIRRRMLGLSEMAYFDIYPPLTKLDLKFDVPASRRLTVEAVRPLGPEYGKLFAEASAAKWVHVYPQKGKRTGAYVNGGAYDVHPYMLLNHTDDYEGLSTYAHEWGHAMHTVLAVKHQPYELYGYPTFTAEVASTVNEQLLVSHMLKGVKGRDERLFYLDRVCEMMRSTFFRQTMFAEFELTIHEVAEKGEALSGKRLTEIYLDLLKRYHGPRVTIDPLYGIEWAYIQHFYLNFYVYQYATSVTAASAFAEKILGGGARERDAYLGVLKAGGSDYPVAVLQKAGVDMTGPEPYRAMLTKFSRTLDEMERLIA
ncbi:oligoendopeptidase F [Phenylobacterium sp.]|uniref:oligoendopeptidase F n=1 Tax=Phenylobacterium sp. TaxID=1871053 RepID=UPI002811A63A|nr:oligoendopeptidase F [Phenylobacterium sp.]